MERYLMWSTDLVVVVFLLVFVLCGFSSPLLSGQGSPATFSPLPSAPTPPVAVPPRDDAEMAKNVPGLARKGPR